MLNKLHNQRTWNAKPVLHKSKNATEFHGKWINYLDAKKEWQPIDCIIKKTDKDFRVVEAPFNFVAPLYANEPVFFESDNKFDVFNKTEITAKPFGVYMKAMEAVKVKGELFDINGDGRLDAVIYKQAFPQWDADLIYYVKHGKAPILEKLVRFNSPPTTDLNVQFHLKYTDIPEITSSHLEKNKTRKTKKDKNRKNLKEGKKIKQKNGFYIRAWDEPQKRGIGIKNIKIWDSQVEDLEKELKQKVEIVDADIKSDGKGLSILTKHIKKAFFENVVYPVYTDTTSTFYPDPDVESTSVDGDVREQTATVPWATRRAAANATIADNITAYYILGLAVNTADITRSIALFDTSALPDDDSISDAVISLYIYNKTSLVAGHTLSIVDCVPATNTNLVIGDFSAGMTLNSPTEHIDTRVVLADTTLNAYNDFTLNTTGKNAILKTGISKFMFRSNFDIDATTPDNTYRYALNYSADQAGTASDPKLVVIYTGAAEGGATPISNLSLLNVG